MSLRYNKIKNHPTIFWAIDHGHTEVVKLLDEKQSLEPRPIIRDGQQKANVLFAFNKRILYNLSAICSSRLPY